MAHETRFSETYAQARTEYRRDMRPVLALPSGDREPVTEAAIVQEQERALERWRARPRARRRKR